MALQVACHRHYEGMFPGDTPYSFSTPRSKVAFESGYCPVCGTRLNADGTTGLSAAQWEAAARKLADCGPVDCMACPLDTIHCGAPLGSDACRATRLRWALEAAQ